MAVVSSLWDSVKVDTKVGIARKAKVGKEGKEEREREKERELGRARLNKGSKAVLFAERLLSCQIVFCLRSVFISQPTTFPHTQMLDSHWLKITHCLRAQHNNTVTKRERLVYHFVTAKTGQVRIHWKGY